MTALFVLRLGHRPTRDKRITTHVCLVARAMGADGIYIAGTRDESLRHTMDKIVDAWGGPFSVEFTQSPMKLVREWKGKGGKVIHLTMYGVPLQKNAEEISRMQDGLLIIVGGEKVPRDYYLESDINVSVGSQPHSEVAALALLLDRLSCGKWSEKEFKGARWRIVPSGKGKNVERCH